MKAIGPRCLLRRQVKLGTVAENIGKLGLAVATVCFVAQTIIWLVSMGQEVHIVADRGLLCVKSRQVTLRAVRGADLLQVDSRGRPGGGVLREEGGVPQQPDPLPQRDVADLLLLLRGGDAAQQAGESRRGPSVARMTRGRNLMSRSRSRTFSFEIASFIPQRSPPGSLHSALPSILLARPIHPVCYPAELGLCISWYAGSDFRLFRSVRG